MWANNKPKVVVTGATGSVGNGLIQDLIRNEYEILVLTRKDSDRNKYIPKSDLVKVLFCSLEELKYMHALTDKNYDVFFHLAWRGTTGSERDDIEMQLNNVAYTVDAVNLAARLGCHTFVGIGSQAECGKVKGKICGSSACNPENAYGAAKIATRHISMVEAKKLGMRHIWVRLLTVYGPLDCNGFVAPTIQKIIDGIVPSFTKGEQLWDFLYYKDAGKALRLIGEKGVDGKIYVIGNGTERTLFSYIEEMNQVLAPNMAFKIGDIPYSPNQVMYLCADNTEVWKDVGWKPETIFSEGLLETASYIRAM